MRYVRRIKELPPLQIGADQYVRCEQICRDLLAGARRTAADGTVVLLPDSGGHYPECRLRDLGLIVEHAGSLLAPEEILANVDYLLGRQSPEGLIPDRVTLEGEPLYTCAAAPEAGPPLDPVFLTAKLLDAYYCLSGDADGFLQRLPRLYPAWEHVALSADHLVHVDLNRPRPSASLLDSVALTGNVLQGTLLCWEAARRLAVRLQDLEEHEEARQWYETADPVLRGLPELYDEAGGLYWAASESGRQPDLWGSAYAAVLRRASKRQSRIIGQWLLDHREQVFRHGYLRPLPPEQYWQRLLAPVPEGEAQQGGYWAIPSGWAVRVVALVDEAAARELVAEMLALWDEQGVAEWIGPQGPGGAAGYVASAACLLGAVRA